MLLPMTAAAETVGTVGFKIVVGSSVSEMQEYAAKELQRYLYQLSGEDIPIVSETQDVDLTDAFVLGTSDANSLITEVQDELDSLVYTGTEGHEGEQGYVLRKEGSTLYIGGTDDEGVLYGVYGLLDDYYGIGFYFSGDVMPEKKSALEMPDVNEAKTPRQYMRGVLPWTNFPQSATVYSTEDWVFVIDQMARMRMNFLNIHNYNGELGHNEVYHNFTYDGYTSRNWNPTARSGHSWGGPGWDVNKYRFGAADLFDDYDFGTDATLHNDNLDNIENFAKGSSQFQFIIDYAHTRGVKIGLGLDINLIPDGYGAQANDPGILKARTDQIMGDYQNLDVLLLYLSENVGQSEETLNYWKQCFTGFYDAMREGQPDTQLAISGWGVRQDIANWVPDDVIVAPIANYDSAFVDGEEVYGSNKEYWGGPWAERDFDSSVYFYPFNMGLDRTITSYQQNKDTMAGMFTLTWRLTDGVDAKISYIAKAPWDREEKYTTEESIYREYAGKCYGKDVEDDMTKLICYDEKTVVPTLWSECNGTPGYSGEDRSGDVQKVQDMIDRVDIAIQETVDAGSRARLGKLRARLVSAQYYCKLDADFDNTAWDDLQDDFSIWAQAFSTRVDDISSLGNVQSSQNRFVQLHYIDREMNLRNAQTPLKAPLNVVARGTADGARLTWEYENNAAESFEIYRDGEKVEGVWLDGTARSWNDTFDGRVEYTVKALADGEESPASIPQTCDAGNSDKAAPQPIVVSPPTSVRAGQDLKVKVRLLDGRWYEELNASIHYRALGSGGAFMEAPMEWRTKATYTANLGTEIFADTGIEYYLTVTDGSNTGVWPVTAGEYGLNATCTVYGNPHRNTVLRAPEKIEEQDGKILWNGSGGDVFWYKIYRGSTPDFIPSAANFVTYVEKGTTSFTDIDTDFDGSRLSDKESYYKITAVDRYLNESIPTLAVQVGAAKTDPLAETLFSSADELYRSRVAAQPGSRSGVVIGYTEAGGYACFSQVPFPESVVCNAVEITYSAEGAGAILEVHADAPNGQLLGQAYLPGTGGWGDFIHVMLPLEQGVSGTSDIYFVYKGGYNLDYFRFTSLPVPSEEDILVTPKDMMAFRSGVDSDMKGSATEISGFGNEGDRIMLGRGFYVDDADHASASGGVVNLPGHGINCFFFSFEIGSNTWLQFEDLPAGRAWLAYDKSIEYSEEGDKLAVYVNGSKNGEIALPEGTGSSWSFGNVFKVMYADTGVVLSEGDVIKFQNEDRCPANANKLFVESGYTAEQLDITYSNDADTQYSLYLDGQKQKEIILPDSGGERRVISVPISFDEQLVELVAEDEDLSANDGAKAVIYQILLCKEAGENGATVTVTAGAGGSIIAENGEILEDNTIFVPYDGSQRFDFIPDEGFGVDTVWVNGVDYGRRGSYTFDRLTYDAQIEVSFSKNEAVQTYEIVVKQIYGGQIQSAVSRAQKDQPVTLEVKAADGCKLKEGTLKYISDSNPDGRAIDEVSTQFAMPAEDVTITAEFISTTVVDKNSLQELYDQCKDYTQGSIPESVWNPFAESREKAFEILNSEGVTQQEVDKAFLELVLARNNLTEGVDKELLIYAIELGKNTDTTNSTPNSVKSLADALEAAEMILKDETATWEEVQKAITDITVAINQLTDKAGNKERLQQLVDTVGKLTEDKYTPSTWKNLIEECERAEEVLQDENVSSDEVDESYNKLAGFVSALKLRAYKKNLETVIGIADDILNSAELYVESTLEGLNEILTEAKIMYDDMEVSRDDQERVNTMAEKLLEAAYRAKRKVDKSTLRTIVERADALNPSLYTEDTLIPFETALEKARVMLKDEELSEDDQEIVDNMSLDLEEKIQALKLKKEPKPTCTPKPTEPTKRPSGKPSSGTPKTGDRTPVEQAVAVTVICLAVAGLLAAARQKRRKKQ